MKVWEKVVEKGTSPLFMLRFHAVSTFLWFILIFPSILWWSESIKWVVLMSVWANLAGHWSGFQAAHGERRIERDNDVAEAMAKICDLHDAVETQDRDVTAKLDEILELLRQA